MKSKKLYYIPGLISLVCLPILLFIWGPPDPEDFRCIKLNLSATNKNPDSNRLAFTDQYVRKTVSKKKKIALKMQALYWDDASISYKSGYDSLHNKINDFYQSQDTLSVMDISFDEHNSYADFIWVTNEMMIDDVRQFFVLDNHFYVLAKPKSVNYNDADISLSLAVDEVYHIKHSRWELFRREVLWKYYSAYNQYAYLFFHQKQNRQLAIGFLIMIAVPTIISIIRSRKKRVFLFNNQSLQV